MPFTPVASAGVTVGARRWKEDVMRTTKRRMVVVAAAGALGLAAVGVAVPAVAGVGPFGGPVAATSGADRGGGNGMGPGGMVGRADAGMGVGVRDGSCLDGADLPAKGTLSARQQSILVSMAQEEKLAHDLYTAFAARYDATVFDRVAASETQHLSVVRTLLVRYGLADPTAGKDVGQFGDATVQATYDRLLAQGQVSLAGALQAAQSVERTDIADLTAALDGLTAADVRQVYQNLRDASQHHLTAFERWA
jgi:hypothetical protein